MASDELKEAIVSYFECSGIDTAEKDWKRVAKRKLADGANLREFHNAKLGRTAYTIGDDEDADVVEKDVWIYGYAAPGNAIAGEPFVAFEPRDRWRRQRCQYDQHQSGILRHLFGLEGLDENCENSFLDMDDLPEAELRARIEAAGFVHDPDYSAYLTGGGGTKLPKLPPEAPIDPPAPPLVAAPAKPARTAKAKKPEELPVSVHIDAVIAAVLDDDPSIWDAIHAARAGQKATREVPCHKVEVISPGVYGVTERETVETDDPLYADADAVRKAIMDQISGKGRIARMHMRETHVTRIPGQVARTMKVWGMDEIDFYSVERDGQLVELKVTYVERSTRSGIEAITDFRTLRTLTPATPASPPAKPSSLAEKYPFIDQIETFGGDEGSDGDPGDYTGRIIFGWFEGDGGALTFACGYETVDGTMADQLNVPEEAFEELFPDRKGEWNASEASHSILPAPGETLEQLEILVRERLATAGCIERN